MEERADAWLTALERRLPRHAAVLRALVECAQRDARMRTVMVGCSIGRGVADELSDIDANMSVADDAWPEVLDDIDDIVKATGNPVEILVHQLPDVTVEHRHVFVQYPDGLQLSLAVQPVSAQTQRGRAPDCVALHDPDDRLHDVVEPHELHAGAADVREWCVLGWEALANVVKYLRRGSLWEANEQLHTARTHVWRLWAVTADVPSPAYGLTSVLNAPHTALPPGVEATIPRLTAGDLAWAAHTCATLLSDLYPRAMARTVDAHRPPAMPMAALVTAQLEELPMLRADEPVTVVSHDPRWQDRFAEQRAVLERLLAPWLEGGIHHVGSTSVPGLAAKPTVDIMAGVRSLDEARAAIPVLAQDGWLYAAYRAQEMHWFCRPSTARREHHLHLVPAGSATFARRLAFRDALRADAALRDRYARLKRELAARFPDDREAYTQAKRHFIESADGTA